MTTLRVRYLKGKIFVMTLRNYCGFTIATLYKETVQFDNLSFFSYRLQPPCKAMSAGFRFVCYVSFSYFPGSGPGDGLSNIRISAYFSSTFNFLGSSWMKWDNI